MKDKVQLVIDSLELIKRDITDSELAIIAVVLKHVTERILKKQ